MADVVLAGVSKVYPDGTKAVDALDLHVEDGELMVLVGPSGCGKTTALRMVAGLEDITDGEVSIGGRVVNRVPPKDRDIAMVFQSYALYPHLTVRDNIAFGLRLRKMPKHEIDQRVARAAEILGLEELLDRRPRQLSGGQRQRVAMGRAIVREPQAFLMDEPLSNLDAKLRVQMRSEIARLQADLDVTTIYVTHDQVEAMTLGDRVAVMRKGVLQQVAPPQALYDRPDNLFVAGFIGSPAMNLVEASVERDHDDATWLHLGDQRLRVDDRNALDVSAGHAGRKLAVGIRPEDMEDAALAPQARADGTLTARVELVEAMGSDVYVHLAADIVPATTDETREIAQDVDAVTATASPVLRPSLVARFNPRTTVRQGQTVEVAVDTTRFHFFDLDTGLALRKEP